MTGDSPRSRPLKSGRSERTKSTCDRSSKLTKKLKRGKNKKKDKKSSSRNQLEDDGTQCDMSRKKIKTGKKKRRRDTMEGTPIGKQVLGDMNKASCTTGIQGILAEFDEIKKQTQAIGGKPKIAFDIHADKNRYKDVYCVDESRVILKWPIGMHDYIHANWVNVSEGRKYICTQGPIATTIDDFWRMVWQEKCKSIIMLCNIIECGKKKCEQYWPDAPGLDMRCASLTIKCTAKDTFEKLITHSAISVSDGTESIEVQHFLWNNWPDRGVPNDHLTCWKLLSKIKTLSPTVIHCSAGIGRTGTIVGLDLALSKIYAGDQQTTLKQVVMDLRKSRHGSVQMDIQYLYMHRVLIAFGIQRNAFKEQDAAEFCAAYEALCKQRGYL